MTRSVLQYRAELETVLDRMKGIGAGRIVGSEMAQFLLIEQDDRGVEIYCGAGGTVVIDPAVGEECLGEISYSSYDQAIHAATQWLNGCELSTLSGGVSLRPEF